MTAAVPFTADEFVGLLHPAEAETVIQAPGTGPGWWAGAPCAVADGADVVLAYRLRRPVGEGRGVAVVIARSVAGAGFRTVAELGKDLFGAESLERPWLVAVPGGWRLYLSCATPGTRHWRVVAVQAPDLAELATARPVEVWPGNDGFAAKDPVIARRPDGWHAWVCLHPLGDPAATDRMFTRHARSTDGWHWDWTGPALEPVPGRWDARGVRISEVLATTDGFLALYDGRADAAGTFEERTGAAVASGPGGPFRATGTEPVAWSPEGGGGLRYVSVNGRYAYYECSVDDGRHELRRQRLF